MFGPGMGGMGRRGPGMGGMGRRGPGMGGGIPGMGGGMGGARGHMRNYNNQGGRGGRNAYLWIMFANQAYRAFNQLPYKPPITIALLGINIFAFMQPYSLPINLSINRVCLNPSQIIEGDNSFARLVLSSIVHGDDYHLYYNMISLLWKGVKLELAMGTPHFAFLTVYAIFASHTIAVIIAWLLKICFDYPNAYNSCAVGFSAVLFCYKYILYYSDNGIQNIHGFSVPTKYAAWAELILISIMVPNASFIGHMAGIVAGYIYVHCDMYEKGNREFNIHRNHHSNNQNNYHDDVNDRNIPQQQQQRPRRDPTQPRYTYMRGTADGRNGINSHDEQKNYNSSNNENDPDDDQEFQEALRRSMMETSFVTPTAPPAEEVNIDSNDTIPSSYRTATNNNDELRRRRLERFS